jgi:DNA primase RepB-like protein
VTDATHPAVTYLTALFEKADRICLTFISASKTYANGGAVTENVFLPMSKVISAAGIAKLTKRNETEHIFVSMAPFKTGSANRTKTNIAEVRHVFVDADENGPQVLADIRATVTAGEIPPPTIVVQSSPNKFQVIWNIYGLTVAEGEALNENLMLRFKTDAASTDAARVLRIPGFRNIKSKYPDRPLARIVEQNDSFIILPSDFLIQKSVLPTEGVQSVPDSDAVRKSMDLLEDAMEAAGIAYSHGRVWEGSGGGWKFPLEECPWNAAHTDGRQSDAIAIVQPGGALSFACLHNHCKSKGWNDFRAHLEVRAGKKLKFGTKPHKSKSRKEGRTYGKQQTTKR